MDASTTIEMQLSNTDNNFFIEKYYSYGDITICFLLLFILSIEIWKLTGDFFKKNV